MIAILGGGLAGLQLGRRLKERGADFLILEKNAAPGGLCRTLRSGEYSWDLGPHGFYSKRPELMEHYRALPLEYRQLERDVRVCHRAPGGRVHEVGYPFENGLADLPWKARLECVAGYFRAALRERRGEFAHLEEWITEGLGSGIARHFMLPYNRKIWSCELSRISMDLVKQKIEPESPWRILRHGLFSGSVGRAYQARFLYPKEGAGAIPDAVARQVGDRLRLGFAIERIEQTGAAWRIVPAQGAPVSADSIVSTIPIPELLAALGDPELNAFRGSFAFNHTRFVVVGLKRGSKPGNFASCQWAFFAGSEVFYRVSWMHNFSDVRPPTLVAEVTAKGEAARLSAAELISRTLQGLLQCGIVQDEKDVALAEAHEEKYTYPIQTVGLARDRAELEKRLSARGIRLLGRSGRWDYINTDGVFQKVEEFLSAHYPGLRVRPAS